MNTQPLFSVTTAKWLAVIAGTLCFSVGAIAAEEKVAKPCREDAAKLCKDVKPGEGRVAKCMKEHHDELSAACKSNIKKTRKRIMETRKACKDDKQKFCPDVQPGNSKVANCLRGHESELSVACKESLKKPKAKK